MKFKQSAFYELRTFTLLWLTQSLSTLGSSMTNFALVVWSFQAKGSALSTALLSVCSYAPYVLMSVFAGALSDRWNKKAVMLVSDAFAALCTVSALFLLLSGRLEIGHLYLLNALNGLMNTVQQPAADVAVSLLAPQRHYQKVGAMRSLSYSLNGVLAPPLAAAALALGGVEVVMLIDLASFALAFCTLLFFIKIPRAPAPETNEAVLASARGGLRWLGRNRGVFDLILFLAAINLTASMYNAALPALLLSPRGSQSAYAAVNTACGLAMLLGSALAAALPAPKSRVRVICNALLLSMSTENFCLAFGKSLPVWCAGAVLGWIAIPVMNANMDALFRSRIPVEMQGRVYAARNTFQFFTIPIGYALGGALVDRVFEPLLAKSAGGPLALLFGTGKGAGAAALFSLLGLVGVATCLLFRRDPQIRRLEQTDLPANK